MTLSPNSISLIEDAGWNLQNVLDSLHQVKYLYESESSVVLLVDCDLFYILLAHSYNNIHPLSTWRVIHKLLINRDKGVLTEYTANQDILMKGSTHYGGIKVNDKVAYFKEIE